MTADSPLRTNAASASLEGDFVWHPDCRHFVGGLPCHYQRPCLDCDHRDPIESRVLIVMLGLLGDMLIASPLPARIKRENPSTHITWLTDSACAPVLHMNPYIDRILDFDWRVSVQLLSETFDVIYSFERAPSAAALVDQIKAAHKAGLAYGGLQNTLYAMGVPARHFFRMNTWNDYRTRFNTKTWTELYFEVAGYTYDKEPYVMKVPAAAVERVRSLFEIDSSSRYICLNLGGSLATKIWPTDHWLRLGNSLLSQGLRLIITGGPADADMCSHLLSALKNNCTENHIQYFPLTIEEFAAVPIFCTLIVTGDSFGFHVALAHQRPCVLLLGPSNGAEVIPKHVTNVASLRSSLACSPCAHQVLCGGVGGCMNTIQPEEVLEEINRLLQRLSGSEKYAEKVAL